MSCSKLMSSTRDPLEEVRKISKTAVADLTSKRIRHNPSSPGEKVAVSDPSIPSAAPFPSLQTVTFAACPLPPFHTHAFFRTVRDPDPHPHPHPEAGAPQSTPQRVHQGFLFRL
jgi:hypothetical protein